MLLFIGYPTGRCDMTKISKYILGISGMIILLVAICLYADVYFDNPAPLCVAVIGSGVLVFALCIVVSQESGKIWIEESGHIQATIAVSIIVEYLVLVGLTAFYSSEGTLSPITQALVTNFTSIVGVVIAFYFGASAYTKAQERRAAASTNPDPSRGAVQK